MLACQIKLPNLIIMVFMCCVAIDVWVVCRLGYVAKRWRGTALRQAFSKWSASSAILRLHHRTHSELSHAQMDILVLQSKLHELASNTDLQATIAGERAINKYVFVCVDVCDCLCDCVDDE